MAVKPHCQCIKSCKNPPLEGSPFCKEHIKFCPRIAPLTGSETRFDPRKFNKTRRIKQSHNCFAYAFDHIELPPLDKCNEKYCMVPYHQPGRKSGYPKWSKVKTRSCPDLLARLHGDVKGLTHSTFEKKCPRGTSKIALVADEDEDYHFYRQDSNGYWSHKPGATDVTRLDATGRPIYDVELAARKYEKTGLDYDKFCSYLCVPRKTRHRFKRGGKRSTKQSYKKH